MSAADIYVCMPPPKSRWRKRARAVMQGVVRQLDERGRAYPQRDQLLTRVDAAYPFTARERYPYKAWLVERRLLIDTLWPTPPPAAPTLDDVGACEVATDLLALAADFWSGGLPCLAAGKLIEAERLLAEQAPHRLNKKCPVCGAKPGKECDDVETKDVRTDRLFTWSFERRSVRTPRPVPHLARVETVAPLRDDGLQMSLLLTANARRDM